MEFQNILQDKGKTLQEGRLVTEKKNKKLVEDPEFSNSHCTQKIKHRKIGWLTRLVQSVGKDTSQYPNLNSSKAETAGTMD